MVLKTVLDRIRRANALRQTVRTHQEVAVQAFAEHLAPYAGDEADNEHELAASIECLVGVLERRLTAYPETLTQVDERYSQTLKRRDAVRRRRDEAAQTLRKLLVDLRKVLTKTADHESSNRFLGLEGATAGAQHPNKLKDQAQEALRRLADPERKLPEPKLDLSPELPETWRLETARKLEAAHARLERALEELVVVDVEVKDHQEAKDAEMVTQDRELSAIANLYESLLVLGRRRDLARTVWQKQRPVGRPRHRKKRPQSDEEPKATAGATVRAPSFQEVTKTEKSQKTAPVTPENPGNPDTSLRSA